MIDSNDRDIAQGGLIYGASARDLQHVPTIDLRERLRHAEASGLKHATTVLRRALTARD